MATKKTETLTGKKSATKKTARNISTTGRRTTTKRKRRSTKKKSMRLLPLIAGAAVGGIFMFVVMAFAVPAVRDVADTFAAGKEARANAGASATAGEKTSASENVSASADKSAVRNTSAIKNASSNAGAMIGENAAASKNISSNVNVSTSAPTAAKPQNASKNTSLNTNVPASAPAPASKNTSSSTSLSASVPSQQTPTPQAATIASAMRDRLPSSTTPSSPNVTPSSTTQPSSTTPQQPVQSALAATIPQAVRGAKLVFVFDDAGHNMSQLENFVTLPFPISVAVLPKIAHSAEAAARVRKSGNEVMLHQPMQAINAKANPGAGAILPEMSNDEVTATVRANIAEIAPVAGVNNHEGSLISEDEFKMMAVLEATKASGAFYLDSRTTSQTRVPQAAMELGMGYYARNIFLDNTKKRDDILNEIRKGLDVANKTGCAIMIGHVWSSDVLPSILRELYPILVSKGYTFSTVSKSGAMIYN